MQSEISTIGSGARPAHDELQRSRLRSSVEARLFGAKPKEVRISRYVVERRIGIGGLGAVYEAHDPELERRLAIKLLHEGGRTRRDAACARRRLAREAKVLAQLDHPNVVAVYDVGVHQGRVYLAMEFLEGQTMRSWLEHDRHSWREIVDRFVEAGRGLEAAHQAGVIHRDFKPDNTMVLDDGRVVVTDFGLARALDPEASDNSSSQADLDIPELSGHDLEHDDDSVEPATLDGPHGGRDVETLTQTGTVLGTPAYMSPEQHLGRRADARADQFAFCTALFEAIYGARPFSGRSLETLSRQVLSGSIRSLPDPSEVPTWLTRAIKRGLATQPADRWPSMTQLLDVLARKPERKLRTRWLIIGAILSALGLAAAGFTPEPPACPDPNDRLMGTWDQPARAEVSAALGAVAHPAASHAQLRVEDILDDYAAKWATAYHDACESRAATHVPRDLLLACLNRRLGSLDALVQVLRRADPSIIEHVVTAAEKLPAVASCATEGPGVEPDPASRRRVDDLRTRLDRAAALENAGRYADALAIANDVLAAAEDLEHAPLRAEAWIVVGSLQSEQGDYMASEASHTEAFFVARAAGLDRLALEAASTLVFTVGSQLSRSEDGHTWEEHARAAMARIGHDDREAEVRLLWARAALEERFGHYEDAAVLLRRATDIWESELGREDTTLSTLLSFLGHVAQDLGDYDEALAHYQRALALAEQNVGPDHAETRRNLTNLGVLMMLRDQSDRAVELLGRALAIGERALPSDHPKIATILVNLGIAHEHLRNYDESLGLHRRALAIREQTFGPIHPAVAGSLLNTASCLYDQAAVSPERNQLLRKALAYNRRAHQVFVRTLGGDHPHAALALGNIGSIHQSLGQPDDALRAYQRILAVFEGALGANHPDVIRTHLNIAEALREKHTPEHALRYERRALAIGERAFGPSHPIVARARTALGHSLIELGQPRAAMVELERALEIHEMGASKPADAFETHLLLARALWVTQTDRRRAVRHARRARAVARGADLLGHLARADRWLTEHG